MGGLPSLYDGGMVGRGVGPMAQGRSPEFRAYYGRAFHTPIGRRLVGGRIGARPNATYLVLPAAAPSSNLYLLGSSGQTR